MNEYASKPRYMVNTLHNTPTWPIHISTRYGITVIPFRVASNENRQDVYLLTTRKCTKNYDGTTERQRAPKVVTWLDGFCYCTTYHLQPRRHTGYKNVLAAAKQRGGSFFLQKTFFFISKISNDEGKRKQPVVGGWLMRHNVLYVMMAWPTINTWSKRLLQA